MSTSLTETRRGQAPLIDVTITGFVNRAVLSGDLTNRSGSWVSIPLVTRTPDQVRDGNAVPGSPRYVTVKVFGPLATSVRQAPPAVGTWITVRSRDISSRVYVGKDGRPRAGTEFLADTVEVHDDARHALIDVRLTGFVNRAVLSGDLKKRPGSWVSIPLCTRTPEQVRDGEPAPGFLRYPTVKVFGALAASIRQAPPAVGTYVTVRSSDVTSRVYFNSNDGGPRAATEFFADTVEVLDDDRLVAEQIEATRTASATAAA